MSVLSVTSNIMQVAVGFRNINVEAAEEPEAELHQTFTVCSSVITGGGD